MKTEVRNIDVKLVKTESLEKEGKRYLIGLIPYDSLSVDLGGFKEEIKRGAFSKTLKDGFDVKCLINHEPTKVLGRIKNETLQLEDRADGLLCTVELGNQSYANDLWESVQRDDVSTMSFGFRVIKDDWIVEKEHRTRHLREVQLLEVSFGVTFPAYEATDSLAVVRSLYNEIGIDYDALNSALIKEKSDLTEEEVNTLKTLRNKLDTLVKDEVITQEEEQPLTNTLAVLEDELSLLEKTI